MTTQHFLELLAKNPNKELVFEYEAGKYIPAAYHITEIKNVHYESIDCGGNPHENFQTIVQLWISPTDFLKKEGMSCEKALKIFTIVDNVKPIKKDTQILIEYGYKDLRTSNYTLENSTTNEKQLILKMFVPKTGCIPAQQLIKKGKKVLSCC